MHSVKPEIACCVDGMFIQYVCLTFFDGFRGVRFCSRGLDGTGSGNRVPGTRGIKKVPGSGDSVPRVPKVTLYFESILLYFESVLLYFESILVYFGSKLFDFESEFLYFESILFLLL